MPGSVGGFRLVSLPEIDSTNSEAQRRARAGEPPGLAITALRQTAARGQHGRTWLSPAGNLSLSILIKPTLPAVQIGQLAFASAVAVAETIDRFLEPGRVQLKWPNDILVDNAKLGGILIESELAGDRIDWVVIGIGLNIAYAPENLAYQAVALDALSGKANPVPAILDIILDRLAVRLKQHEDQGFEAIRTAWQGYAWRLGQPIRLKAGTRDLCGSFIALDQDGALLLATASGEERITAGSLAYESAA